MFWISKLITESILRNFHPFFSTKLIKKPVDRHILFSIQNVNFAMKHKSAFSISDVVTAKCNKRIRKITTTTALVFVFLLHIYFHLL